MKALIVYGSKHGSTREIAERMSRILAEEGMHTITLDARESVGGLEGFDAVIIGSAVRMRSWLKPVVRFTISNRAELRSRKIWLFSSGLMANDPRSTSPRSLSKIEKAIGPREHRFFIGSLDLGNMGWFHRLILRLPGLQSTFPVGDERSWDEIESWVRTITRQVHAERPGEFQMIKNEPVKEIRFTGQGREKTT